MQSKNKFESIKIQVKAVELLRLAKEDYSYQELMKITGIPITVLNRYIKGHILPSPDRAAFIISAIEKKIDLSKYIKDKIIFDKGGFLDHTKIIGDTLLLRHVSSYVMKILAGKRISKVLTVAVDGIPLAAHIANAFDVPFVYAKKEKEVGVSSFIEESYALQGIGMQVSLYLPKGLIEKKDSVLITDDVIRSGEQLRALINIVKKIGAEVAAIFILITIGNRWRKEIEGYPVYSLVELSE
ncbi:MAG: phosphoribosyltransferase family protein [Candidatus Methanomethyliaceae archaeon]|nr:phosphoribosyltransferase family protein [Candidatus Methanomethyliaceae archaeon]MDW7971152.1 phosphoribosyltransferase family protein [Nitrososphaerota archaeon]